MKQGQWYPGSMARAVKVLRRDLKVIDLVVELLDARIPISSQNPTFAGLLNGKKHLILLHKADRADMDATGRWHSYYNCRDIDSMAFSVNNPGCHQQLLRYLKKQKHNLRSVRFKRPLRIIFVGIPNVGKSTLINYFVRKAVARTANQPGITRGPQWIRITPGLELLDTPGILWPNLNDETVKPLTAVGAIPFGRVDMIDVAVWLINIYLHKEQGSLLVKRYQNLVYDTPEKMLEIIGFNQGCLQPGGKVDLVRAAQLLIRDFQGGALGRITLEEPPVESD